MAIYRGPGGAGDATGDATNASALALAARDEAIASATSAASSSTAAGNSATAADASATSAATQASTAAGSATSAATSATNASSSATAASSSATTAASEASDAADSATDAASSASAASTSASNASTSATNAASSASTASTQASNASTSASSAATSATNAASSATAAASSATDAAASAASIDDASLVHKATDETITGTKTFTANQIISVTDNTDAALRITQLGTGNALLVEDSTNPDSTPFVINASGKTIVGATTEYNTVATTTSISPNLQTHGTSLTTSSIGQYSWGSNPYYIFSKAGSGGIGTYTAVATGTVLGAIQFSGADGTAFVSAAMIRGETDGTPGTNDMPGRLVFSTTADGASSPTERMRITSSGNIGIGKTPTTALDVNGTITATSVNTQNTFGFKNRIINGAMMIDQRATSVTANSTTNFYTVDRWRVRGESSDGVFTAAKSSTAPTGFQNSLLITVTTADASIGATQIYATEQLIEGYNVADLGWGAAGAATVTLSFWVRSSLTGTFGGSLRNDAGNRSYPFTYTISAANTWEQKTITVAGDTTGTWEKTTSAGMWVNWSLGVGSDRKGTAGAWNSNNNFGATGETAVISTSGATFYITGVQLEKGSTATSFDYRPYGTELALCQRYYGKGRSAGIPRSNDSVFISYTTFKVDMRAAPTVTPSDGLVQYTAVDAWSGYKSPGVAGGFQDFTWTATAEL